MIFVIVRRHEVSYPVVFVANVPLTFEYLYDVLEALPLLIIIDEDLALVGQH
jgi:hypothetical protein